LQQNGMTVIVPFNLFVCVDHEAKATLYKLQKTDSALARKKC